MDSPLDEYLFKERISSAPLTRRHFELIGKIIIYWSTVEFACASLACKLARNEAPENFLIMLYLSSRAQLDILQFYTKAMPLDYDLIQELRDLYRQIDKVRARRNKFGSRTHQRE
jgi:hypothetical protein